jgi:hypothetical protein
MKKTKFPIICASVNMAALGLQAGLQAASEYSIYAFVYQLYVKQFINTSNGVHLVQIYYV